MTSCPSKTGADDSPLLWRSPRARAVRAGSPIAIVVFCVLAACASAQTRMSEYAVKAAYLFNFGKFVRFAPAAAASSGRTFDLCIVGEDPFGESLDDLTANEQLDDKPVSVLRLKKADEARGCAIAYISASEGNRVGADVNALRGRAVLTVSDAPDFLQRGGMIQLLVVDSHVRFAVNLGAVRSAQLGLSSELLRVAISVNGEIPPGVRP